MARDSRSADEQFPSDYRIGQPTGDKPDDIKITRGQGTLIPALVHCGLHDVRYRQRLARPRVRVEDTGKFGEKQRRASSSFDDFGYDVRRRQRPVQAGN